ncbi:T9SS type A sorting domain-containing protein [Polaribacter haliotis]|uniref:T9SS type A sorting domain-containing protein n=1 Tax=Polaribacter haliotis TaxID=1888915 RepID=A0A7L8AII2_9FLAO|nr:T9SS type A sorting domain-containing protein [Polaribacter haliotis]QOD61777.1 T9SS type A sorting domain-containing protein [Polaribacter haliotis]
MKLIFATIFLTLCIAHKTNSQIVIIEATLQSPCASLKIKNPYIEELNIFPNPTNGKISIKGINKSLTSQVKIYDVKGSLVFTKKISYNNILDVSRLNNGFYFLKYENSEKKVTKKLIIQK